MRTCDLCHSDILKFHSYHINGTGQFHMMCEMGRVPMSADRVVDGDAHGIWGEPMPKRRAMKESIRMQKVETRLKNHKKVVSGE